MEKILKKLDKIQEDMGVIKGDIQTIKTDLGWINKIQEKHEYQINNPNGRVSLVEKEMGTTKEKVEQIDKAIEGVKIYLGLIAVGVTIIINFVINWVGKIFNK